MIERARQITILFVAVIVFACAKPAAQPVPANAAASPASVLDQVKRDKVVRVGYSGYPPFLTIDPTTKLPRDGFSVDLITRILHDWDSTIKIKWVPTNWTNVRTDLNNNKFDLIVEPVFRTIPRAAIVDFSRPYSYFGYAVGVVRINDNRFHSIKDLDNPNVLICVAQSLTSHEYVKANLPHATNLKILSGGNIEATIDEVLLGRVDITLADYHTIKRYIAAHPGKVKAIFTNPPPSKAPAGLMFRQGDYKWAAFINTSLEYLEATGDIDKLKAKYDVE